MVEIGFNKKYGWHLTHQDEPPAVSPHWPGVGRYIGVCPQERDGILLCPPKLLKDAISLIEPEYQRRRIYSDEVEIGVDYINKFKMKKLIKESLEVSLEKLFSDEMNNYKEDYQIIFDTKHQGEN